MILEDDKALPKSDGVSKAFLSHSSVDKAFVEAVGVRLGRVQVFFDKWCFETGDEFIKSIPVAIAATDLFVLFASKASLASMWVRLEIDHAQTLLASVVLRKAIVFILDDEVNHSDLPRWMQSALISKLTSPNSVARAIQGQLDSIRGVRQRDYFFGRDLLMHDYAQRLLPSSGVLPPNILAIAGLPGTGRRTFARQVVEQRLSMRTGAFFHLRKGDGLDALHLALLTETAPLLSKAKISAEVDAFRLASLVDQSSELLRLLELAADGNVAPMIVDDGAFLEADGLYTKEAIALLEQIRSVPTLYVVLVQHRLAPTASKKLAQSIAPTKIPPLDQESTQQFLAKRFADNQITATPEQIHVLAQTLSGYPPAVNMATGYAKNYGLPMLLNNRSVLTSFQQQEFADVLGAIDLTSIEWGILRLLASGMEVPVEAIIAATKQTSAVIVPAVQRLIDLSLVLNHSGVLGIATPLLYAVRAMKGNILPRDYDFIGKALKEAFWDNNERVPDYGVLEATVSALLKGEKMSELEDFRNFVVPSMLLRSAQYQYKLGGHDNWLKAQDMLHQLLNLEPKNARGLSLALKIQVRLQIWPEAEKLLEAVKIAKLPDRNYLEGFLLWKRRKYKSAIPHFKAALALGQDAEVIYHGLANCLLRLKQHDDARKAISDGLRNKARPSIMLVDLGAKIAIESGRLDEAEAYIEQLKRMKVDADYHHRVATLLIARNKSRDALTHARQAAQSSGVRFEIDTVLVSTLINVERYSEAEEKLGSLDKKYRFDKSKKDVRLGLRCKLLLRQGHWDQAEPIAEELNDQNNPVYAAVKKEILQQKIRDKRTSIAERNAATLELITVETAPSIEAILGSNLSEVDEDPDDAEPF